MLAAAQVPAQVPAPVSPQVLPPGKAGLQPAQGCLYSIANLFPEIEHNC